jgi:hypothetical protein
LEGLGALRAHEEAAEAWQRCVEQRTDEAARRSERIGARSSPYAWVASLALRDLVARRLVPR